jgi:hypothetical protein
MKSEHLHKSVLGHRKGKYSIIPRLEFIHNISDELHPERIDVDEWLIGIFGFLRGKVLVAR